MSVKSTEKTSRVWHQFYVPPTRPYIGDIPYQNLPDLFRKTAKKYSKQTAFLTCIPNGMNGKLSFQKVDELSDAFAIYLREKLELKAGDRVALQTPNCLSFPVAAFGILKAGCVLVNTNPLYTAKEMKHQFNDAQVSAVIIIDMFADKIEKIREEIEVKHILVNRISDFFPPVVGKVINLIQKYWNQQTPNLSYDHSSFAKAVQWGRKNFDEKKLKSYLEGVDSDSLAVLQYTGGTTGVSKGGMLTHGNLIANIFQVIELISNKVDEGKECILTALPLYHIFAFTVNLMGFYSLGGKNILIPSPRPLSNLKRALENYPVTWLTAVNTLLNGLCNEIWFTDSPPKSLKATASGGMALQGAVAERWEKLTGTPVVEGYGLTEASPVISFNPLSGKVKRESIGIPVPSTDVKCVQEDGETAPVGVPGELWCKGPQIMKSYWNNPEETEKTLTEDGWLKTGDIAVMDEDGYLKIVDRKKDMIVVSGFNVYPNEVEDCIARHEKVLESAVIGIPDEKSSEVVKAYVVKKDEDLTSDELIAHCRESLTGYKVPKYIEFREDLPKSPVGKILRKELRKEVI